MNINGIEFSIIRSCRKTLAIEVRAGGEVIVRAPLRLSEKTILLFVESRREWILKAVKKQKQIRPKSDISQSELAELKNKAENILPGKAEYFSKIMGLKPTAVKIGTAKTRFGSCSGKNSLNFSAYLMNYPEEAVDYVVVHELAHIKHKNHQKEFYALIAKYLPDYKRRVALLRK